MTTPTRNFRRDVPVSITARCIDRRSLLEHREVRDVIRREIAKAPRYGVTVEHFNIRGNHIHVLARQSKDGCRKAGAPRSEDDPGDISGWMGAMLSAISRVKNRIHGRIGHGWERTFHSRNLETLEEYVQQLAYIEGQDRHHAPYVNPWNDEGPYKSVPAVEVEVDGLTTHVPHIPALIEAVEDAGLIKPHGEGADDKTFRSDEHACRAMSVAIQAVIDRAIETERLRDQQLQLQSEHQLAADNARASNTPPPSAPEPLPPELYVRTQRPWRDAIEHLQDLLGIDLAALRASESLPRAIEALRPDQTQRHRQLQLHHLDAHPDLRAYTQGRTPAPQEGQTIQHIWIAPPPRKPPD